VPAGAWGFFVVSDVSEGFARRSKADVPGESLRGFDRRRMIRWSAFSKKKGIWR
jgi:hypothetical protein